MIAIICIMIILIMITVNLGQIGIFRTDVSDAADAGALAGASVLSGTLLGLGLKSDMMCGESTVCLITATVACCWNAWTGIAILISSFISQLCACFEAMEDASMGWTNAKKTALQYAFNNAGIDEPRPTFETFLKNAYSFSDIKSLTTSQIKDYYDEFIKGESDKSRKYGRQGFSSFIEDTVDGYWKEDDFGKMAPGEMSDVIVTSGYGWEQIPGEEMFYNSYNNLKPEADACLYPVGEWAQLVVSITGSYPEPKIINRYDLYRNYVEVTITGTSTYALDIYGIEDNNTLNAIAVVLAAIIGFQVGREIGGWWGVAIGIIVGILVYAIMYAYPMGLQMINEGNQYEGNPVRVTVKRHKGEEDLGLWKFHYGTIEANAKAHVYREHKGTESEETIEPCFGEALTHALSSLSGESWNEEWFDKNRHLFEVKLIAAN